MGAGQGGQWCSQYHILIDWSSAARISESSPASYVEKSPSEQSLGPKCRGRVPVSCSRGPLSRALLRDRVTWPNPYVILPSTSPCIPRLANDLRAVEEKNCSPRPKSDQHFSVQPVRKSYVSRVLPETLTGPQLLKKFPVFYGTGRFFTTFTRVHHLSISWASSIQSMPPIPHLEDSY